MKIHGTTVPADYTAKLALDAAFQFHTHGFAEIGMEHAAMCSSVYPSLNKLSRRRVLVNQSYVDQRIPVKSLVWECRLRGARPYFAVVDQEARILAFQFSGIFTTTGSATPNFSASSTTSSYVSPYPISLSSS